MNRATPFGLYIHWPFCKSRCPYCDYNAHVRERVDVESFGQGLMREMEYWGSRHNKGKLTSIFFGGGTPSLMPVKLVGDLIERARNIWGFADDIEITLEANPTSSEAENFAALADCGVNRLSLGVQALDDGYLKFLRRTHSAAEAIAAIHMARKYFSRYSFDIIYARPNQTLDEWRAELDVAIPLLSDHISLYQLSVEPQTAFANEYARGAFYLPDDDDAAILYDYTTARLAECGLRPYEVSSFSKTGGECRHNLVYWRYCDYIGIGCGAHGRITDAAGKKTATANIKMPENWHKAVLDRGHGLESQNELAARDAGLEMIMMNLRLQEGIDVKRFRRELGIDISEMIDQSQLQNFIRAEFLESDADFIRATAKGRNCLNEVLAKLIS